MIQMYPNLAEAMERAAVRADCIQDWVPLDDLVDEDLRDEYEGPLWAVLAQHAGGEARTVVLNQTMKQEKSDGFAPSRILHAFTHVLNHPTIDDERQVLRIVEEWDAAKEKLKIEFGKELREVVQIAVLTGMLPSDLQDKVFGMSNGGDVKYNRVRDAIVSIMNNRARVLEQTPMDTGQVGGPAQEVDDDG